MVESHFVSEVIGGLFFLTCPKLLMLAPATGQKMPLWCHLVLQGVEKGGLLGCR